MTTQIGSYVLFTENNLTGFWFWGMNGWVKDSVDAVRYKDMSAAYKDAIFRGMVSNVEIRKIK